MSYREFYQTKMVEKPLPKIRMYTHKSVCTQMLFAVRELVVPKLWSPLLLLTLPPQRQPSMQNDAGDMVDLYIPRKW